MLRKYCVAKELVQSSLCNAVFSLESSYYYLENWPSELFSLKYASANELLHSLWKKPSWP